MAVKDRHPRRRTQAERSAATRGALLRAARHLYAKEGYAATGREAVVARAGVTRGALYHHFASKEALFRAVYEELEAEVVARVAEAAASAGGPLDKLRAGALAYLDAALEPEVARIALLDAPAVLPPAVCEEILEAHAMGLMREALRAAMDAGAIEAAPLEPLAHILVAALHEAALYVARAADQPTARREVGATVERLLTGLAPSVKPPSTGGENSFRKRIDP